MPIAQLRFAELPKPAELVSPSLGDEPPERLGVIGEVQKRRGRGPLLSHEQQRGFGRAQQQRRRRAIGGQVHLMVQPFAKRPVADLVVVLKTDDVLRRHAARPPDRLAATSSIVFSSVRRKNHPHATVRAMSGTVPLNLAK